MDKTVALIGVGTSAGAHWPGQEKAPLYLREAGLIAYLKSLGLDVIDYGDLPVVRFQPDIEHRSQQNLKSVVEVCNQVREKLDSILSESVIPIVIGGDCTISLGVISAFLNHYEDLGVLYFDGHVDLNTPVTSTSGILDSMGVAHMIGLPGAAKELSQIGKRFPLIKKENIVLFGYNPSEINTSERDALLSVKLKGYPISDVQGNAMQVATNAVKYLESQSKQFIVHFDVDVIDFTDLPIADVPQFGRGLMFKEVLECLTIFTSSMKFNGLTVTELNPDHADSQGKTVLRFIKGLANALVDSHIDITQ